MQEILESCLKPNAAERPQSAVDLYLRLQEMGKASGILLLPPGAMEKLAANRLTSPSEPTVAYVRPGKGGKTGLWWALALAGAATVAVVATLLWLLVR